MGSEKADQKSFGIVMFKVSGILPIRALFLSHVAFRFPKYSSSNTKQMLNLLPLQEREKNLTIIACALVFMMRATIRPTFHI